MVMVSVQQYNMGSNSTISCYCCENIDNSFTMTYRLNTFLKSTTILLRQYLSWKVQASSICLEIQWHKKLNNAYSVFRKTLHSLAQF